MDTLDYRYYRAALDAARVDQTVVNFNMGLWCDRTPVKPILEFGCTKDGDCAEDDICVVNVACPLIEDFDADGNCLLSKEEQKFMKDFHKTKHKAGETDLKESQSADKQFIKDAKDTYGE